ncbi:glycoside hydrolase family 93 protein [Pleomassaria siparia CBS 279.74]|uniref:Glycoside hydrolase family 93 protein n=1 Tax=Pleomassaria siparia CBS 279.74 TaxID=1314801 RepID=A0A6G1JV26_9PLEO|nr:glycoside hydrolase family 93 protein [Pleomassaria siparia CBS 279.74]
MLFNSILLFSAFIIVNALPISPALNGPRILMSPGEPSGEYPRSTSKMDDGSMIGGFTLTTTENDLVLKSVKSIDGGASWQALGEVFRGPSALHDINNPFPFVLEDGRVLYAYRNHERQADGTYTWFRISISYSDDGGVNFKYLCTVDERAPSGVNGLWEPFIRYARDGTLQIFYSSENSAADQDSIMRTSGDGGQTWSGPKTISGAGLEARDGMLGIAPTDNNGALIAVFETTDGGRFVVDSVTSPDDGATWGNRQRVYTPTGPPTKGAGAPQVWNVWGTLVVSFMTDEDRDSTTGYANCATKIMTSTDGGNTWGNKFTVFDDQANWPGMALLDPTHLLVMAGINGQGATSQNIQLN